VSAGLVSERLGAVSDGHHAKRASGVRIDFGAVTAGGAHAGGFGQFVSSFATTGPGMISGIVAGEHAEFCAP